MRSTHTQKMLALRDGTCVEVRYIRPDDAPALKRLVGRLSEKSAYLRYFGPMKELSDGQARYFAEVDGKDRFALVALDPDDENEIVAVVRYDRQKNTDDAAEYAALVEDSFQGKGLGVGMTRHLIEAARERGIKHMFALVLRENRQMLNLLRALDLPEEFRWQDGAEHVAMDLR